MYFYGKYVRCIFVKKKLIADKYTDIYIFFNVILCRMHNCIYGETVITF